MSVRQYFKESLIIGKGHVNKVIGEVIEYTCSLDTQEYYSGFPLLNEKLKVVGIQISSNKLEQRGQSLLDLFSKHSKNLLLKN